MAVTRVSVVLAKLCAVIVVVLSLQSISGYAYAFADVDRPIGVIVAAFVFVLLIPAVIAAALWFFPATVIGLKAIDKSQSEPTSLDAKTVLLLGISLVGLYVLITGLIDLFYYEAFRLSEKTYINAGGIGPYQPSAQVIAGRYTSILQAVLGALVLAGRGGISAFLLKIRSA